MMTNGELAAIEARANAATPGPWEDYYGEVTSADDAVHFRWLACDSPSPKWEGYQETEQASTDSAFIAAARMVIPALIAEVRRLRALLEQEGQA